MTVNPKTLIYHCLIGLRAKIVESSNPQFLTLTGYIVDETKNTLILQVEGKEKRIPKKNVIIHFYLPDKTVVEVNGKLLLGRPEERVKKKISYKWNNIRG